MIGIGAGAKGELDLRLLMAKRGRIHASMLRARPLERSRSPRGRWSAPCCPLASGEVRVPVAATYPLERAEEADEHFAGGGKLGKIVLIPNG